MEAMDSLKAVREIVRPRWREARKGAMRSPCLQRVSYPVAKGENK